MSRLLPAATALVLIALPHGPAALPLHRRRCDLRLPGR
ncbi:hypothetical protein DSC_00550 [Pseudoxanthomonas spadix BD-a59]|jgi:hypothetical protein|uniref:Uncharacterized protein n=1 Tax=Pseudoxanthomonas spadix (strain BD-a59) TaxID=1045855 RepID=G7US94_PSEUP|nr:hypothetical protein DSC_00550 [Pseudoxanthomonas spadix BD-a59]